MEDLHVTTAMDISARIIRKDLHVTTVFLIILKHLHGAAAMEMIPIVFVDALTEQLRGS